MIYEPRQAFIPFHNRQQRWASLNTHRRAGKTVALVNDLLYGALECQLPRPNFAYIGPTYAQSKRIAWQYLKDFSRPHLAERPRESDLILKLKNNATIYVLGADNADSLRGMYLDGAVMDEYALFRPSVWQEVIRPTLSDRHGWGVFASTPRGKNLFYDTHRESELNPQEWHSLTLKADTSGLITPRELKALQRELDPETYAQEYLCSFDAALKGSIYADEVNEMFHEGRVVQHSLYDPSLPTHWAFDIGITDATVAIAFQLTRDGGVAIVAVEATTGKSIFHHIERVNQFKGKVGTVFLPHDAKQTSNQTGVSVVEQFVKLGIRPRGIPLHKIRDGISAARKVFPRVHISEPSVGELVEALKAYRRKWDDTKLMFTDEPVHDWASDYADAFRYLCIAVGLLEMSGEMPSSAPSQNTPATNILGIRVDLMQLFEDNEAKSRILRIS